MSHERYDREAGEWVPIAEWYARRAGREAPESRSDLKAPMIISDNMDALRHPATGLYTDSKSSFRKMTQASGCVEVGDQPITPRERKPVSTKKERVSAIKQAMREQGRDVL